ncbi:MAG: ATP-binding protein [Phycisphaeraceae bacterium]
MSSDHAISIVVIDDDLLQLKLIAAHCERPGPYLSVKRVLTFSDPAEAVAEMPVDGVTAILCDYDMPVGLGVDWLPDLIKQDVGPVLMLTATGDENVAARAFRMGVSDYLLKADVLSDPERLQRAIAEAARRYKMHKRNRLAARELKLVNLQLEDRNQRLHEMTETAHRFVDNVAHEFRTPLTVIQEFASILADGIGGPITEEQMGYLEYIRSGVRDLSALVDDFLDTSKLKARTLRVDRSEARVSGLLERVRPTLEARAQGKSIAVGFDVEPGLPTVFCDAEKAARVIINLVVNAVKFSPQGGQVEVSAAVTGNGDVRLSVRDHGVGIAEQDLPALCERFSQADTSDRGAAKGFGLGLNIARDLVWLNLGEMSIDSAPGQGSTFSFTLPVADPEHVLTRYARQLEAMDHLAQVNAIRLTSHHPQVTAETLRQSLTSCCRSWDLLLRSADERTLIALGPADQPDRWIERMQWAWATHRTDALASASMEADWLGAWSVQRFSEQAMPAVLRELLRGRKCA